MEAFTPDEVTYVVADNSYGTGSAPINRSLLMKQIGRKSLVDMTTIRCNSVPFMQECTPHITT